MARIDMLDEALSMVADVRAGAGRGRAFGDALLRTMSSAGDFHAAVVVPVYPRDVQRRDLESIGQDMYRAMEAYAETEAPRQG